MRAGRLASPPVALVLGPSLNAMSGVTTHVSALLASRLARAYRMVHFQVGSEGRRESAAGRLWRLCVGPFALAAAIVRHDAAIVHINVSLDAKAYWRDLAHLLVAKLCGARVVLQKHGGELSKFAAQPLFRRFLAATLRLADAIVVLSENERQAFGALVPQTPVAAVPNGIDPTPYLKYNRAAARPGVPLKLLYIGRLAQGKGLLESLEALALACANGLAARLVIAGSGPEEEALRARVRALRLSQLVTFAGPARGDYKTKLLCNADVLLLPSYSEGLPYALLEAMAAGVVPIVTPVGAIPDVVRAGELGALVPVGDPQAIAQALAALDADRSRLARMSRACRARVLADYSLERLASDFARIYSALMPWPASQAG